MLVDNSPASVEDETLPVFEVGVVTVTSVVEPDDVSTAAGPPSDPHAAANSNGITSHLPLKIHLPSLDQTLPGVFPVPPHSFHAGLRPERALRSSRPMLTRRRAAPRVGTTVRRSRAVADRMIWARWRLASRIPGGQSSLVGLRSLWLAFSALAMVAVGCSDSQQGASSAAVTTSTGASSSAPSAPTTSSRVVSTASTTAVPTTSTTTVPSTTATSPMTTATTNLITRPYIDPSVCEAGAVSVYTSNDITYRPFALTREEPIPLQVIAEPSGGLAKPFAVVVRLFASDREFPSEHPVIINGTEVNITISDNGNGQAAWSLPDGSKAYLRSRDLDQSAIEALVARLTPRDRTAPLPGFDIAPADDPNELVVLHEHLNTGLSGTVTIFECRAVTSQYIYRVRVIDGDPVFVHFGIIDVPRPYAVGVNGDGAITIYGLPAPDAPTLQQVVNADPATWAALPIQLYEQGTSPGSMAEAPLLEPGQPQLIEVATHCGVGFLSRSINGHWWRTAEASDQSGWLPAEWSSPEAASGLLLELLLSDDGNT